MSAVPTLKKNKEFGYVYRRGKTVPRRDFTLIYTKSRYGGIRSGFAVSKKVGGSVERNKVRRRLKEAVRVLLPECVGHFSLIVVARPQVTDAKFSQLVNELRWSFEKAGILPASGNVERRQKERDK